MSDKQPIAVGYIIAAVILGVCFLLVCGIFIGREIFRCPPSEPITIVRDDLYWEDVEKTADSLFGTIDTITKVDTVWLTKTRGYVTSLAPDSLIAIHLLPPSTRRADTTGNAR